MFDPTGRESVRGSYHCDSGLDTPHSSLRKLAQWLLFSQGVLGPLNRAIWAQPCSR